jgi:hypothetical protein
MKNENQLLAFAVGAILIALHLAALLLWIIFNETAFC